jgi:hypothetical protein
MPFPRLLFGTLNSRAIFNVHSCGLRIERNWIMVFTAFLPQECRNCSEVVSKTTLNQVNILVDPSVNAYLCQIWGIEVRSRRAHGFESSLDNQLLQIIYFISNTSLMTLNQTNILVDPSVNAYLCQIWGIEVCSRRAYGFESRLDNQLLQFV